MAGTKRSWEGNLVSKSPASPATDKMVAENAEQQQEQPSLIQSMFTDFRNELDEHHDRRERIIKASRDITALSKKIVRTLKSPLPKSIAKETTDRLAQITSLFTSILPDLTGINAWRYQWQISPGIQEYIEAATFNHYIQTQEIMSLEQVVASLPQGILVTEADYVLGLFDLTGEMMRFAVTAMVKGSSTPMTTKTATTGEEPSRQDTIVVDLRELRALFESLNVRHGRHGLSRDMPKKMEVMQASVEKVERAAYGLLVRGSERPGGWVPDLSGAMEVESY
ncbi:hypothetical protein AJ80_00286 [Polytolypa hystricis UAMH7299]|uniref:Translin-associated factor TraX n=1 Tax=Polytolypa hystricis (strain UAMH7299) TaxID=1447883 RepID=A0A2B7Z3U7_POLH7|nr:hypothetical protein AJ80_00286 [Polytolypa hystricis UAMH7299]